MATNTINQVFVLSDREKRDLLASTCRYITYNTQQAHFLEHFNSKLIKISPLEIEKVIFNNPATIVFWTDGSKTVVKTSPNDKFDKEKGILWAYAIKNGLGSKTQVQKEIMSLVEK